MEKEENNNIYNINKVSATTTTSSGKSPEFVLQWGKRLRCVRFKEPATKQSTNSIRRKITSRVVSDPSFSPLRSSDGSRHGKSPSPEKEERYYATRGSAVTGEERENGKCNNGDGNLNNGIGGGVGEDRGNLVWPKLYISLSSKEKEEDFLAMKGCKLPQRPKKRAKFIQRTLLLVSPGAWLTDMCQERYEVREDSQKEAQRIEGYGICYRFRFRMKCRYQRIVILLFLQIFPSSRSYSLCQ